MTKAQGEALAKEFGMQFFETSAKKDIGVSDAFSCIAKQVVARLNAQQGGSAGGKSAPAKVELKNAPTPEVKRGGFC